MTEDKEKMSPLSTPIQNVNPSQYNIVGKTKNIWIGKEKIKLYLSTNEIPENLQINPE